MRRMLYIILGMAAICWALVGCNTSGCTDNQSSIPLAGFYGSGNGQAVSIDSVAIGGVGAPDDSLLVSGTGRVSEVYLPLRSSQTTTTFYFRYLHKALRRIEDVIAFEYESIPFLVSEECGAMYQYRIKECAYTTYLIDHVEITDSLITNTDVQKIKIYFRTASDE